MAEYHIHLSEADERLLRRAARLLGMSSLDAAAEWLLKARLARTARQSTGRGRALYMLPRPRATGGSR